MGPWEIQQALGISRSRFREIVRKDGFPAPLDDTLRRGAVWYEDEVMAWIAANRPKLAEDPEGE
jgi:predicted DNA-binding transcriptional regulator AlpA